jgi:hypothetical protein
MALSARQGATKGAESPDRRERVETAQRVPSEGRHSRSVRAQRGQIRQHAFLLTLKPNCYTLATETLTIRQRNTIKMENWHPDDSVIDGELATILRTDGCEVSRFTITESAEGGFYCTFRLSADKVQLTATQSVYLAPGQGKALNQSMETKRLSNRWMFLATRRVRDAPRIFINLTRLTEHIKAKFPGVSDIRLLLLSGEAEELKVAAKKLPAKKAAAAAKQAKASASRRSAA